MNTIGEQQETPQRLSPTAIVAGMSGNLMEWYDFALYGVLASTLGELFFPGNNGLLRLLAVYGVFAAGYLSRIAGGALFGHVADRGGRKKALLVSVMFMGATSTLVGCLPTYATAGFIGPVLLLLLRILQGVAVGGEFATSVVYLVEHARPDRRGVTGSLVGFTCGLGILLGAAVGNLLFMLFSHDQVIGWAWRLPFLISIPAGTVILLLRLTLPQDETISLPDNAPGSPLGRVLREHPGTILRGIFLGWAPHACFVIVALFSGSFLITEQLLPGRPAMDLQTEAIAIMVLIMPFAGWISDRFGRKPTLLLSGVCALLLAWPLFHTFKAGVASCDRRLLFLFAATVIVGFTPYHVWLAESFPKNLRVSGVSLSLNGAAGILGGTMPLLCTASVKLTGSLAAPAALIAVAACVSIAVAMRTRETARELLRR